MRQVSSVCLQLSALMIVAVVLIYLFPFQTWKRNSTTDYIEAKEGETAVVKDGTPPLSLTLRANSTYSPSSPALTKEALNPTPTSQLNLISSSALTGFNPLSVLQSFPNDVAFALSEIEEADNGLSDDGILRSTVSPQRFLGTERFAKKYGLTNILMSLAAMMAYASYDNRALVLPSDSPVNLSMLLDINRTQENLIPANVVFATGSEILKGRPAVFARKLGLSFGNRIRIGSMKKVDADRAYYSLEKVMRRTSNISYLVQRDFFLSFPFRSKVPLDLCFYLQRTVFHRTLRHNAESLLRQMKTRYNISRFLALHLRLEADVHLVVQKAALIKPMALRNFLETEIVPLARQLRIEAVYVCAGNLPAKYMNVIKSIDFRILLKTNFDLSVPAGGTPIVTNHYTAAVDAMILQHATAAVVCIPSTFSLLAFSKRCPSPAIGTEMSFIAFQSTSTMVKWDKESKFVDPPIVKRKTRRHAQAALGVFGYIFDIEESEPKFAPLRFYDCTKPLRGHCFYNN